MYQRGACLHSLNAVGDTALQCAIKHGSLLSAAMLIQALSDQQFTRISSSLRCTQVNFCLCFIFYFTLSAGVCPLFLC